MPQITKRALSQFIRTQCKRQLALNLFPDNARFLQARQAQGMPYPQSPRPGLRQTLEVGEEWQAEKLEDLTQTFGASCIVGDPQSTPSGGLRYKRVELANCLPVAIPLSFIVEAEFPVKAGGSFETALGIDGHRARYQIEYAKLRPDIVEVTAPRTFKAGISASGSTAVLEQDDTRRQLRVIDIKLTAQPSPGYFAEVALYSMALAGWLEDEGLDDQFVVVPDGALWPGSHQASALLRAQRKAEKRGITLSPAQLRKAMRKDLEPVPFDVFVLRVRWFLREDVPSALSKPWREQEWHVDNRCSFCEYLGEDRPGSSDPNAAPHPDHCLPMAEADDHLSRVAFVSQGARLTLEDRGVGDVGALARLTAGHKVYDAHQALRATRTVVSERAESLAIGTVGIAPLSGTSASMPKWADLRLYLSVDFDIGSAITVAFGLSGSWYEPRPLSSPLLKQPRHKQFKPLARIVIDRDLSTERRELLAFLKEIHDILEWCGRQDNKTLNNPKVAGLQGRQRNGYRTKVQIYVWDSLQFDHFARIIGRHLDAILKDGFIKYLAWLFPPEELVPNPDLATRRSPITIIRDVVRTQLAAPIAHYYSLLGIARRYHPSNLSPTIARFQIHPLFGTPLSDQVPSERAHEIWAKATKPVHWQQQMAVYQETVKKRLSALENVTKRLEEDLRSNLQQDAPVIEIRPPEYRSRVSTDGQLWYAFSRLNSAVDELDVRRVRAMPPHERAARFRSARLSRRLIRKQEQSALKKLGLALQAGRRVYRLRKDSVDVKAKVGDIGFALAPETVGGLLDRSVSRVVGGTSLEAKVRSSVGGGFWQGMERLLSVTISGIDRSRRLLAVDANRRFPSILDDLESAGILDLSRDAILDPVHRDYLTPKLLIALKAVGNPTVAQRSANPLVRAAIGQGGRGANTTGHTPVADCLWNAGNLSQATVSRSLSSVRSQLRAHGMSLNRDQRKAWKKALTHRAWLIWGPPGTGKSRVIRAVVVGAVLEAVQARNRLRVLVSAFTYTAIDNVLYDIAMDLSKLLPGGCDVLRLRSSYREAPQSSGAVGDVEFNVSSPSWEVTQLRARLRAGTDVVVVGAPPQQVHNLLTCGGDDAQAEWFDLIAVDEASQMDVANAVLPLCGLASDGSVVMAGDPLQLPPIHQASAPKNLEAMIGSVYSFWQSMRQVRESRLGINYRSNAKLVSLAHEAGYSGSLTSQSPNLTVDLTSPIPRSAPANWPSGLVWSAEWASMLDPARPAVCFVYSDGRSSQSNRFEADAVAAMLWLLHGRVSGQMLNENNPRTGVPIPSVGVPYTGLEFWQKAVGVVTPHRAQQGLIVSRLLSVFNVRSGPTADAIRDAVDTVERFQGQQRDIIVASYTLGDPDQIAEEDEFLLSLNRFNVVASRARGKLIVLVSQDVVGHLANDTDVLRGSKLLKVYAESFCDKERQMVLGVQEGGQIRSVSGRFRWRS